jgi:mannose-6-phosphate isomerase
MDPLVFAPFLRPQVWGGRRLEQLLGKRLPPAGQFGESWEISAHPLHVSRVSEGPYRGQRLDELWTRFGADWYGPGPVPPRFPWLVKLLDCDQLLSVQVHPNDAMAAQLLPGESGKTEAWVVLHAEPCARIYAGLLPGTTPETLEQHLAGGTVSECLHWFSPRPGDALLLPAGTVHSAGGGLVFAEIQQSSDATFRLFDWNRTADDGRPRPLHTREALASIDWAAPPISLRRNSPAALGAGELSCETLVEGPHFRLERYQLAGHMPLANGGRMSAWMVLAGQAELAGRGPSYRRRFRAGESVFVPASAVGLGWTAIEGEATLLMVDMP